MSQTTYGFCSNDCKQEIYTKEDVLQILQQAIDNGTLTGIDTSTGFIESIKDQQGSNALTFAICTSAEYAAIVEAGEVVQNRLYLIKDDATFEDLENEIETISTNVTNILEGTTSVPNSETATNALAVNNIALTSVDGVLKIGDTIIPQYIPLVTNANIYSDCGGSNTFITVPITVSEDKKYRIKGFSYANGTSYKTDFDYIVNKGGRSSNVFFALIRLYGDPVGTQYMHPFRINQNGTSQFNISLIYESQNQEIPLSSSNFTITDIYEVID